MFFQFFLSSLILLSSANAEPGVKFGQLDSGASRLQPRQFQFCPPRVDCTWQPSELDCAANSTKTCACIAVYGIPNSPCDTCAAAILCVNGAKSTSISQGTPETIPPFPTNAPTSVCHNECSRIAGYARCTSTAPYVCLCSVMLLDAPGCSQCLATVAPAAASEVAKSADMCRTLPPCASPCTGPFTTATSEGTSTFIQPSQSSSLPTATATEGSNLTAKVTPSQTVSVSSSASYRYVIVEDFLALWIIVSGVAYLAYIL